MAVPFLTLAVPMVNLASQNISSNNKNKTNTKETCGGGELFKTVLQIIDWQKFEEKTCFFYGNLLLFGGGDNFCFGWWGLFWAKLFFRKTFALCSVLHNDTNDGCDYTSLNSLLLK